MGFWDRPVVKKALLVCYSGAITTEIRLVYILARSFALHTSGDVLFYVVEFSLVGVCIISALVGIWDILRKWGR